MNIRPPKLTLPASTPLSRANRRLWPRRIAIPNMSDSCNNCFVINLPSIRHESRPTQHIITQRKAAIDATRENIQRLAATVPMETERATAFKRLLEQDAITKLDYLQAERQRIDKSQELAGQQQKLRQDQAALSEAENNCRALISEFQQTKQAELSTLETKAASISQDVTKARQKAELQRLTTPIDGVVQQLAVHTVGGVVTPAQPCSSWCRRTIQWKSKLRSRTKMSGLSKRAVR